MSKWVLLLWSALLVLTGIPRAAGAAPQPAPSLDDYGRRFDELRAGRGPLGETLGESERLARMFDLLWDYQLHLEPSQATQFGYPGLNDRWHDLSEEALARRKAMLPRIAAAADSIQRAKLGAREQIDYDLLRSTLRDQIDGSRFPSEYLAIGPLDGLQYVPQILTWMPASTPADYRDILTRLRGVPILVDQTIALLEKGLRAGVTQPRITMRDVPDQVASLMPEDPAKADLLLPFQKFPAGFPAAERLRLSDDAVRVYRGEVVPSLRKLHRFLVEVYIPGCRETVGMRDLPDGKAWYAYEVRHHTTTDLTPEEIHKIGLSEVVRIRKEMDSLIARLKFKGTYSQFLQYLQSDPRFFFNSPDELVTAYRALTKKVDPELMKLFGRLPRQTYGVAPVPAYAEKSQTSAYYQPGSPESGRPGYYFVNTYDLKSRPKWEMAALTLHEAVPGHHLQAALIQELQIPPWRKYQLNTAYLEGWALYAESLGDEMGLYEDPYAKFGQLSYEMWRAVRLVVDTGIHSMGWSRERAIAYCKENASKADHDIVVEVDRYLVWPGQALAYKIGQMKIRALRTYAERQLGAAFDIRAFHDEVLDHGIVPLGVLENNIRSWVEAQRLAAAGKQSLAPGQ
jgi:uncharacterized protein (DUF885 family)